jgi:hypothetical protein
MKKRDEKINKLKHELDENEVLYCTLSPRINKKSATI